MGSFSINFSSSMRVFVTLLLTICLLPSIALAEDATGVTRHYKFDVRV